MNQVFFGDCSVGVARKVSFTLTNHLEHDAVRFSWSPPDGLTFSPCTGHLLANCAKDISVSFTSDKRLTLDRAGVNCKVTKIKLAEDGKKVKTCHIIAFRPSAQERAIAGLRDLPPATFCDIKTEL